MINVIHCKRFILSHRNNLLFSSQFHLIWFSLVTPIPSTNITEMLLKVALNAKTLSIALCLNIWLYYLQARIASDVEVPEEWTVMHMCVKSITFASHSSIYQLVVGCGIFCFHFCTKTMLIMIIVFTSS